LEQKELLKKNTHTNDPFNPTLYIEFAIISLFPFDNKFIYFHFLKTTSSTLPMAAAATTAVTSLDLSGKKGEFQRSTAKWRHWIRATTDADGTYLCDSFFTF
jgi:hypothetical protein